MPRDKVLLGCISLFLMVLAFLVLEAACPPGLVGMPTIGRAIHYAHIEIWVTK